MGIKFSGSDAGGFRFDFSGANSAAGGSEGSAAPKRERKPRKAVGTPGKRIAINTLVTLLVGAVYFYLELPAINLHAEEFYGFVLLLCAVYCGCALLTSGFQGEGAKGYFRFVKKQCTVPFFLAAGLLALAVVGGVASWVVFRAGSYQKLLTVQSGDFSSEIAEVAYDRIPMLDKDSAEKLGDRKLGELSDMVSQFEVSEDYTQINYHGRPVRVTPLRYGDIIKWFNNRSAGLPAYLIIDMVDQSVDVVRLDEGMKYTTAEHFSRNLYRHLRFQYPTFMFEEPVFEIDEDGTPYWVCAKKEKTIGLFGGTDNNGAVLVNAVTGESEYLTEPPEWVDHVYSAELIIEQYDYYGMYHNGFINSILGQRDVTVTTDGYNYIAEGDDVYLYTGPCAGATEYSAMDSAEGQVQNLRYTATFPLLLNVAEQPTYFMALKDASELVKMYAMVNVNQYQIVATGATVAECESNYRQMLRQSNLISDDQTGIDQPVETDRRSLEGVIAEIRSAVVDGNSIYFLRFTGETDFTVRMSAADVPYAPLLNVGDRVRVWYYDGHVSELWIEACDLELLPVSTPAEPDDAQPSGGADA